ncbi:MAG: UdgX family uracil-DNA binding protein [Proteobacteria bacterium]|nr:UdgX family uracil-DNA binding protein [Pseudomonadota bacterium]
MPTVALARETDWAGWRAAARALVLAGVAPDAVRWRAGGAGDALPAAEGGFGLPRALVDLATLAFQARDPDRFPLLYRLVWRAHAGERVLDLALDPDVDAARALALAVRAEAHRMRTHVRFLRAGGDAGGGGRLIGWYAPAHFVLEASAQLIARRFPDPSWSILTPDGSAHCDGGDLRFGPGVAPPADDAALAALWGERGGELLAGARPGTSVPEAEALEEAPRPPDRPALGPVVRHVPADAALAEASAEAVRCRRCPLWEPATQTVFGEGPPGARLLLVGEQPGDQEDVIGRPFVGPAGQLLDQALEEAGIDRRAVYITNAVKHFKFVRRGKRRIHERPDPAEMHACAFWLDVERVRIAPRLTVLMGATAARSVLGRPVTITRERGRPFELAPGATGFVTVHPSFLLRLPDEAAKAREYRAFVADLREAARIAGGG